MNEGRESTIRECTNVFFTYTDKKMGISANYLQIMIMFVYIFMNMDLCINVLAGALEATKWTRQEKSAVC